MLITTTESIPGKEIRLLGFVKGIGTSGIGLTTALQEAAEEQMVSEATKLGADAIVAVKYVSHYNQPRPAAEMMAYGTAIIYVNDEA